MGRMLFFASLVIETVGSSVAFLSDQIVLGTMGAVAAAVGAIPAAYRTLEQHLLQAGETTDPFKQ